jgi:hypothetical protein
MYQLLDPGTEEETPLLKDSVGWLFLPAFAPDAKQVALYWNHPWGPGLWVVSFRDSDVGQARQIAGLRRTAVVSQAVDATGRQGRAVRLRAMVKTDTSGPEHGAQCWLRVDRPNKQPGFFDNMANRPIRDRQWTQCEIIGTVADDAERIAFGAIVRGSGRVWLDGFDLAIRDSTGAWRSVEVPNAGFEQLDDQQRPLRWASTQGYSYRLDPDSHEGRSSLLIENPSPLPGIFRPIGWSEDSSVVYAQDDRSTVIAAIPVAGGEPRTVFSNWPNGLRLGGASVTPDGRRFVLSLVDARTDVWIVDHFDQR